MFTFKIWSKIPLFLGWSRMPYYAVAKGKVPGIYKTWDECKDQTQGFSGAAFKKFNSEAECKQFIAEKSVAEVLTSKVIPTVVRALPSVPVAIRTDLPFTSRPLPSAPAPAPVQPAAAPVWVPPSVAKATATTSTTSSHCSSCSYSKNSVSAPSPTPRGTASRKTTKYTAAQAQQVPPVLNQQMHTYLKDLGQCLKRKSSDRIDTRPTKLGRFEFLTDDLGYVHVFTDGSCVNNGKRDARAGLGVYFGEHHPLNLSEPVRGKATNNSGEIQAAIQAIKQAKQQGIKRLCINTDSHFVVNSITMWVPSWKKRGWKLASGAKVKNEIDFRELDALYNDESMEIKWNYVKAHVGTLGNERADQLAKDGADEYISSIHFKR